MNTTPVSLLERVRQRSDQRAWTWFVTLYTPLIFNLGRKWGLQAEDAADLTQDVFATLFRKLPEFSYDHQKSFRSWLRRVAWTHFLDRRKRAASRPIAGGAADLDEQAAPDDDSAQEEEQDRLQIVNRTMQLIQGDFQPITWQAFWQHGVEHLPAEKVAAALGLSKAAVYSAKCRVLNRLREELQGLLD